MVYLINDENADLYPKSFYISLKQKVKKVQDFNKEFEKVDANIIVIKTLYENCKALFSLKFQLYKRLKDSCISSLQLLLLDTPTLTLPISIITLKSLVLAIGLGLAF